MFQIRVPSSDPYKLSAHVPERSVAPFISLTDQAPARELGFAVWTDMVKAPNGT
jgi:hypothetical protein